jgi:hypothetical protein
MSGSETERDGDSEDDLTPLLTQADCFENNTYLEGLSQLDDMLPVPSRAVTASQNVHDETRHSVLPSKRTSLLVPPHKITERKIVAPLLSGTDLKEEAIRIIKKLPRGEVTMWGIMSSLTITEMRNLGRYKGYTKTSNSKEVIGQRILKYFEDGDFESVLKSIDEDKSAKLSSGKKKCSTNTEKKSKQPIGSSSNTTTKSNTHTDQNNG